MKRILFLWLIYFSFSAIADPECDYHFSISNATLLLSDDSQMVQQPLQIYRGQNSPGGRCKLYRFFFSKGLANNYQRKAFDHAGAPLIYNLHSNINQAGVLKDFGDAVTANEFIEGESPEKFTFYSKNLFISLPGLNSAVTPSGTYTDIVQVSVYGYNENSGNYLFESTDSFTVMILVPKQMHVSLVEEGGAFDQTSTSKVLDFGLLSEGQEKSADLRVQANSPYRIKISSQNNGVLRRGALDAVAYSLRVNTSPVNLSTSAASPVEIGSGGVTSSAGDKYNLQIRIYESTSNKTAGLYQDILTITAIAN